jgi:hypothetical protein
MISFSRVYIRPNTTIPFHNMVLDNTEYRKRLVSAYINTGKLIEQWTDFSEDSLSMTYHAVWTDRESFDEHDADPILNKYWAARDEYCRANNIIIEPGIFKSI